MSRIDYYRAVLLGAVIGVCACTFIYMLGVAVDVAEPQQPQSNFEVVDTYNDRCDVVRYTPTNSARYYYFLDCSSK
jgi:hypothetical protein